MPHVENDSDSDEGSDNRDAYLSAAQNIEESTAYVTFT